jgi:hypothetical protein
MQEQNQTEWEAPPPPAQEPEVTEPPQMSEAATLGSIFFEPGQTFEDLRRKPRFIVALLIIIALTTAFQFIFVQKMGEERMKRAVVEQMDKNPQMQSLPPEQRERSINVSMSITTYIRYLIPVFVLVFFAVGGLIYWLAGKAAGGSLNYWHGLSAWVYSSFPPTVVTMLCNFLILFLKSPDEIDISASQRGLIHANPSFFIDGKEAPVLATILSTFDFFLIWGWVLAAIGLQKIARISSGASWAIVLILALISLVIRVLQAVLSGNPM